MGRKARVLALCRALGNYRVELSSRRELLTTIGHLGPKYGTGLRFES